MAKFNLRGFIMHLLLDGPQLDGKLFLCCLVQELVVRLKDLLVALPTPVFLLLPDGFIETSQVELVDERDTEPRLALEPVDHLTAL